MERQACFPSTVAPFGPYKQGETGLFASIKQWTRLAIQEDKWPIGDRLGRTWCNRSIVEADKAVAQGAIQISYGLNGCYAGRIPETDIETGGIFFWEDESQCYECLHKYGLFKLLQNTYARHGLYWSKHPVKFDAMVGIGAIYQHNPESMKGRKLRTVGIWGEYVKMLGGTPVAVPWGDVYMAAKLGTIDGWLGGIAMLEELKLKEVAKSVRLPCAKQCSVCNYDQPGRL